MPFVLDASIVACWAFDDEDNPAATIAWNRFPDDLAFVPALWWFEIRNTLVVNERRGRISQESTATFLHELSRMPISADHGPDSAATMALARKYQLTVCDASYLELALRENIALATIDKAILRAARALQVPLVGLDRLS